MKKIKRIYLGSISWELYFETGFSLWMRNNGSVIYGNIIIDFEKHYDYPIYKLIYVSN